MTVNDFKAKMKSGDIPGWYIFAGEEEYLKRFYSNELCDKAASDPALDSFNHIIFDGADMTVSALAEAFYAPPMMADYKLVEWRHAELDKLKESDLSALEDLFSERESFSYVVFSVVASADGFDTGTDKKPSKLLLRLSEMFGVMVFDKSTDAQLLGWLKRHFENEGIVADMEVLNAMLFRVGHSMQTLREEVTKLSAYAKANGRKQISVLDVIETCAATVECDAFAISNAIIEKNIEKAFLALSDMKQNRIEPLTVLAQLSKVYGDLLSISIFIDEGLEAKDIESIMKFHPYRLKIYMASAKKMGTARLAASLEELVKTDAAAKAGGINGYKAVEMFITQNI